MGIVNFRKYARVEVDIPVHVYTEDREAPREAYLNNLSEEGGSLISMAELPVATTMEFDIPLPAVSAPAHVKADVLWSRQIYENGKKCYAHGLIFNRIEVDDRERLHVFVQNAMSY
ncbi:PilZ domain-containing protein [candidate division FCPU426 bacterium]|nr:PilZ domain-containing protein [candidate division FCPU426 bacterium]